jgi:uncharacterized protein with HEPN domain
MSRDSAHVLDILEAARKVRGLTRDVAKEAFFQDEMRSNATIYQLIIMGEATKRLSTDFRDSHPAVPWRKMAGMRDILIDNYTDVDLELVWEAATQSVPDLIAQLEPLVPPEAE